MSEISLVKLKSGREKSIYRKHPWVFSGGVHAIEGEVSDGDLVVVVNASGQFLALGHYQKASIMVKILSWENESIDQNWFNDKLKRAKAFREMLGLPNANTNAYRLVHGEGDLLPGLVIDVYADTAVVQAHSAGMQRNLTTICNGLLSLGFENVVHKPSGKASAEILAGKSDGIVQVKEHGYLFRIDAFKGQKTGFFIDQRENRKLLFDYAQGKSVLNVFSYTGGFSVSALFGGATRAVSVDSSAHALNQAVENAMINDMAEKHEIMKVDAVPYLESLTESFDIIVLDPPAFAKHKSARHNAIQAYRRINEAALRQIAEGGLLFTFSCSEVVDKALFESTILSAAINAKRHVQVLHYLAQPADHPVSIFHKEGAYLKGLVLRVL